jgi:hypothetical protein
MNCSISGLGITMGALVPGIRVVERALSLGIHRPACA